MRSWCPLIFLAFVLGKSQKPGKKELAFQRILPYRWKEIFPYLHLTCPLSVVWDSQLANCKSCSRVGVSGKGKPRAAWRWFGRRIECEFQSSKMTVSTHFREGSGFSDKHLRCGKWAPMPFILQCEKKKRPPHHSAAQPPPPSPSCLPLLLCELSSSEANLAAPAFNDVPLLGNSWDQKSSSSAI